mgnify:CR=1 FL=1
MGARSDCCLIPSTTLLQYRQAFYQLIRVAHSFLGCAHVVLGKNLLQPFCVVDDQVLLHYQYSLLRSTGVNRWFSNVLRSIPRAQYGPISHFHTLHWLKLLERAQELKLYWISLHARSDTYRIRYTVTHTVTRTVTHTVTHTVTITQI